VRSLGIAVHLPKKGRPTASAVVLDGSWDSPNLVATFDLTSSQDDVATQLHDLASGLRSRVVGLKPNRVVIRRADYSRFASNAEGPRLRLLAEGALAAAARGEVSDVLVMPARDLAARSPAKSKDDLDKDGANAVAGANPEAAAAALAGLVP
jgi:hypothetical protein